MDFNAIFSSTTPGADIIFALASSSINLVSTTIPFWLGWFGILIGLFFGFGIPLVVWYAISAAISHRRR